MEFTHRVQRSKCWKVKTKDSKIGGWVHGDRDGVGDEGKGQRKNGGVEREIEFKRRTQKRASKTQAIVDPLRGKVRFFFFTFIFTFP